MGRKDPWIAPLREIERREAWECTSDSKGNDF
jgi:hypothetical protein